MGKQMHTPGPWQWMNSHGRGWMLATPHSGQLYVMDFVRFGMQGAQPRFSDRNGERRGGIMHNANTLDVTKHPDARLIAAAPDLLDALESIEQYGADTLSGRIDGPDDREWQREGVAEMTRRARAAIAKARGEQPDPDPSTTPAES